MCYSLQFSILYPQIIHPGLYNGQVWRCFDDSSHAVGVGVLVALSPEGLDRRPFLGVQGPELDAGVVTVPGHLAPECVELADDVRFGDSADRGVAGHPGNGQAIHGDECRRGAHSCGCQGGFTASVSGANNDDFKRYHDFLNPEP